MKTTQIHMYLHELPSGKNSTVPKKSGKPSRPARGPRCGVMVARVLDDQTFGIHASLTHPTDKFDQHVALPLAVGKLVNGEPLPKIFAQAGPATKRAMHLFKQFHDFSVQAQKVFKDKSQR